MRLQRGEPRTAKQIARDVAVGSLELLAGGTAEYVMARRAPHWYGSTHKAASALAVAGTAQLLTRGLERISNYHIVPQHENDYAHRPLEELLHEHGPSIANLRYGSAYRA